MVRTFLLPWGDTVLRLCMNFSIPGDVKNGDFLTFCLPSLSHCFKIKIRFNCVTWHTEFMISFHDTWCCFLQVVSRNTSFTLSVIYSTVSYNTCIIFRIMIFEPWEQSFCILLVENYPYVIKKNITNLPQNEVQPNVMYLVSVVSDPKCRRSWIIN